MSSNISVKKSTINSLQIIFAYQGQQLIKQIGKKKGWDKKEIDSLIKELINTKNLKINIIGESMSRRGHKNLNLKCSERCIALTANEEQCSRRRNKTADSRPEYQLYCGIHLRKVKTPNGLTFGTINLRDIKDNDSNR